MWWMVKIKGKKTVWLYSNTDSCSGSYQWTFPEGRRASQSDAVDSPLASQHTRRCFPQQPCSFGSSRRSVLLSVWLRASSPPRLEQFFATEEAGPHTESLQSPPERRRPALEGEPSGWGARRWARRTSQQASPPDTRGRPKSPSDGGDEALRLWEEACLRPVTQTEGRRQAGEEGSAGTIFCCAWKRSWTWAAASSPGGPARWWQMSGQQAVEKGRSRSMRTTRRTTRKRSRSSWMDGRAGWGSRSSVWRRGARSRLVAAGTRCAEEASASFFFSSPRWLKVDIVRWSQLTTVADENQAFELSWLEVWVGFSAQGLNY